MRVGTLVALALVALALVGCASRAAPAERCYQGSAAAAVAKDVEAELARDGWGAIVVEPYEGQVLVRARRGTSGVAGKIEDRAVGCDGARLTLREVEMPAGAGSRVAGPRGPRTSRP